MYPDTYNYFSKPQYTPQACDRNDASFQNMRSARSVYEGINLGRVETLEVRVAELSAHVATQD